MQDHAASRLLDYSKAVRRGFEALHGPWAVPDDVTLSTRPHCPANVDADGASLVEKKRGWEEVRGGCANTKQRKARRGSRPKSLISLAGEATRCRPSPLLCRRTDIDSGFERAEGPAIGAGDVIGRLRSASEILHLGRHETRQDGDTAVRPWTTVEGVGVWHAAASLLTRLTGNGGAGGAHTSGRSRGQAL